MLPRSLSPRSLTGHGKPDPVDQPYVMGWFSSTLDRPVFYGIPDFPTVQDYMSTTGVNIWLYDRMRKKRRVTLRVPTPKRDRSNFLR